MNYKIKQVHLTYKDGQLKETAVLWESNEQGWVRATYATNKPTMGYKFLTAKDEPSPRLFQSVAGLGMNLPDNKKKKYFPGKHLWEH